MAESFAQTPEEADQLLTEILHEQPLREGLKIRALSFCENLSILSLALSDGSIANYKIEVSAETCEEYDDDYDDEDGKNDDNILCKRVYVQIEGNYQ